MKAMNLWVVITTINEPTLAISRYIELSKKYGFRVLIVGDVITPDTYKDLECEFLSIDDQKKTELSLGLNFPSRHYARKNFGYLYAISCGAEYIFDTDDDNIPYENFFEYINRSVTIESYSQPGFINAYRYFVDANIWPRGFPLREITKSYKFNELSKSKTLLDLSKNIVQFMADGEPDVDAIYRLIDNKKIYFPKDINVLALKRTQFCPFNSQATLIPKRAFLSLYLPFTAPFRMTDIWRSFVFQLEREHYDCDIVFAGAIVYQDRNPHDYLSDFKDEVLGYLHNEEICKMSAGMELSDRSYQNIIYSKMVDLGVIDKHELAMLECWASAVRKYL